MSRPRSSPVLEPDLQQAAYFFKLLGEESDAWTFQTFDDKAEHRDPSLSQILHAHSNKVAPQLVALNRRGAGVFAMINRGDGNGRKAANVTAVRAVFVDLDGTPVSVLDSVAAQPHLVVESSPGRFHAYWRIEELPLERFAAAQVSLAKRFLGDPSVKDLPRVMRVPGFFHQKGTPFQTRILRAELHQPYMAEELFGHLGIEASLPVASPRKLVAGQMIGKGRRNAHLTSLAGTMQRRGMSATAIEAALNVENQDRCQPPMGPDEVAGIARSITRYASSEAATSNGQVAGVAMRCLADVTPMPIEWLWPNRMALGKLTLIAGDPGLGKSLLSIAIAAHVTRGENWPVDDAPCPPGEVLLLSAEDDVQDTIRPRLDAAEADPARVHALEAVFELNQEGAKVRRTPNLTRDIEVLDEVLSRRTFRLVVIDPVSAYLGGVDTHRNADLRAVLAPLADLAARHKVAIICVSHLTKGVGTSAIYRTTGSIAFVAAARAAFIVARDPEDDSRRLVLPVKNNLAEDRTGLAYRVQQGRNGAPVVAWDPDAVTVRVDEALALPEPQEQRRERQQAEAWLRQVLADGPMPAKDVQRAAQEAGYAWRTVQRAKREAEVVVEKEDFAGGWRWSLPTKSATHHEGSQAQQLAIFTKNWPPSLTPAKSD